jgi:hypothetical protein
VACAHEAIARASKLAGTDETAQAHADIALKLADTIVNPDERDVLMRDLASL